ncbi:MAG: hypothetical protein AB7G93_23245 [Bdellovibrionales bacterium]
MNNFELAIACFLVAALLGIYLLSFVLRGKETRKGIALLHAPFAAGGLIFLAIHILANDETRLYPALGLFVVTALGGFYMFAKDITGHRVPKWLALVHGTAAASSLVLLFVL